MMCSRHSFHGCSSLRSLKVLKKVGDQTALRGDEEGVVENLQGNHRDDRLDFLTISDNNLSVDESAGSEEQAG
jgi:hypothetical protein